MIVTLILYLALTGMALSEFEEMLSIVEENCKVCCSTGSSVPDSELHCNCSSMIHEYEECAYDYDGPCELCFNNTINYEALDCTALLYDLSSTVIGSTTSHVPQCSTEESLTVTPKATSVPLMTTSHPSITLVTTSLIISEPLIITLSAIIPVTVIAIVLSIILITYLITSKRRRLHHNTDTTGRSATTNITGRSATTNITGRSQYCVCCMYYIISL